MFDSHRPIMHTNINSEKKVFIIDDNKTKLNAVPVEEDFDSYEESSDSNSEDYFESDEDEDSQM